MIDRCKKDISRWKKPWEEPNRCFHGKCDLAARRSSTVGSESLQEPEEIESLDTTQIDNLLENALRQKLTPQRTKGRRFGLFSYGTLIHASPRHDSAGLEYEQALFPSMNPNFAGGIVSICSCMPQFRVTYEPGDVIFCFPQQDTYFDGERPRTLTGVLIIIERMDLAELFGCLPFKSVEYSHTFEVYGKEVTQHGDLTARFYRGEWQYAGIGDQPHSDNRAYSRSLNDSDCLYRRHLIEEKREPYAKIGCTKSFQCQFHPKNCGLFRELKLKKVIDCYHSCQDSACRFCLTPAGGWKYDILFKYGLVGSCRSHIPKEFRSFYMGSKGWPIEYFLNKFGKETLNPRHFGRESLNSKGPEILKELQDQYLSDCSQACLFGIRS